LRQPILGRHCRRSSSDARPRSHKNQPGCGERSSGGDDFGAQVRSSPTAPRRTHAPPRLTHNGSSERQRARDSATDLDACVRGCRRGVLVGQRAAIRASADAGGVLVQAGRSPTGFERRDVAHCCLRTKAGRQDRRAPRSGCPGRWSEPGDRRQAVDRAPVRTRCHDDRERLRLHVVAQRPVTDLPPLVVFGNGMSLPAGGTKN
jgi:hypothetical protein